jgi:hypothetical protein
MGKTKRAKNLLTQALQNLPDDFALSEARTCLIRGLREIEKVEKKRAKREGQLPAQPQNIAPTVGVPMAKTTQTAQQSPQWTPEMLSNVMHQLDDLIEEERQKIEELHRDKTSSQAQDFIDKIKQDKQILG